MLRSKLRHLVGLCFLVCFLAIVPTSAEACMTPSCDEWCDPCACIANQFCLPCIGDSDEVLTVPAGPESKVTFLDANRVQLTVQGYDTTQLEPETTCVVSLPPLDSVASVDSVVNYDGRTDAPFSEVEFYYSEGRAGIAVAEMALEEGLTSDRAPWVTFQSNITGTVEDGVPNYFVIELTLNEGVDPLTFIDELRVSGFFLTSGSNEVGIPNHHPFFRQIGSGPILLDMPSSTLLDLPNWMIDGVHLD